MRRAARKAAAPALPMYGDDPDAPDVLSWTVTAKSWIPPIPRLEARTGRRILRLLGCGNNGCAFMLDNGRVLKVATSREEVLGVRAVLAARARGAALPGIARCDVEPQTMKGGDGDTVFYYVREAVRPFDEDDDRVAMAERYDYPAMNVGQDTALTMASRIASHLDLVEEESGPLSAQNLKADYLQWLTVAAPRWPEIAESLGVLAVEYGVYLTDADYPNIGLDVRGVAVVFDYELGFREKRSARFVP